MKAEHVYNLIRKEKIIVIARGVKANQIIDIAQALYAGGIKLLEVTCNTDGVFEMIKMLREKMADKMCIGAGTVITPDLCEKAVEAGAQFFVAPDTNIDVIDYAVKNDIAILPGAATATEILLAKRHGAKMVKIFPASELGIDYIKALRGPIDDVDFVAVSRVRPENMREFFSAGCIAVAVGTSIMPKEFVEKGDWKTLSQIAQKYVKSLP